MPCGSPPARRFRPPSGWPTTSTGTRGFLFGGVVKRIAEAERRHRPVVAAEILDPGGEAPACGRAQALAWTRIPGTDVEVLADVDVRLCVRKAATETEAILSEPGALAEIRQAQDEVARGEGVRGVEAVRGLRPKPADTRMAIDPDGKVKPVSEFKPGEKWWCDGEGCGEDLGYPHVHVAGGCFGSVRRVDLETGRDIRSVR